jgi:protein-S-isoprenylcysteine O-methyltransferase Ste14
MDTGPETHRLPEDPFGSAAMPFAELTHLTPLPPADSSGDGLVQERELRPEGRLKSWQVVPIAALAILGSLMFAFPLAFEAGDAGSLVGMLGLLLTAASAGWGAIAARRAGYTWPGLPRQGSGGRAGWRALLGYTAFTVLVLALGVWRVSHISG